MMLGTLRHRVEQAARGRLRGRIVLALAAVVALDGADKATIGATATNLEDAFSIGKVEIGLLLTVTSLVGAVATLPFGALVDRVSRTRLLAAVIGLWAVAMLAGAAATSYTWLLSSRIFLGLVTAAVGPVIASLVGDWFLPGERGRIMGLILAGDLVGTGLGITVSGIAAAALSWRASFVLLAVPAAGVAVLVHRLPEPARGGAGRLEPAGGTEGPADARSVADLAADAGIAPEPRDAPSENLAHVPLWRAVRYVLQIRTNVILIVSSALGYYLFAGVRTFGIEYADEHYGVGQGLASVLVLVLGIGGLVGVVSGGRIADRLLARGRFDARIVVPAVAFVATAVTFAPAIVTTSLTLAVPLLVTAGFFLAVANPPLDAARLDVVPPLLWGRAEATRSVLRVGLEALAPLVFGAIAGKLFGGETSRGLEVTFLIMVVPLVASGLVLLLARRSYLVDAATADAVGRSGSPHAQRSD